MRLKVDRTAGANDPKSGTGSAIRGDDMKSIHQVGLTFATIAAVATLAGSFFVQGYAAARQAQAVAQPPAAALVSATASLPPEIVYIAAASAAPVLPAATAQPAATPQPVTQPQIIHVVVPASGGGEDSGD
jgi:hypothetical protein